ncbi:N-acetylneuraminate synthase family protein [Patescibacteria group bacterium]|nr:N-acetylneuraminate synthase family protein [Patescibacteria group bacterium]
MIFAEEGQANQGDFSLALKMIEIAAQVGADGIEFQLALADDLYIKSDPGYELYLQREFSSYQIKELVETAKSFGLTFQAACFSPKLVDICVDVGVDVFCINAMDFNNPVMLDAISDSGLPFWLSTLMGTLEEIDWAVDRIVQRTSTTFGILHGQHIMASDNSICVPPEITQLDCIASLKERYGVVTGFVDHTPTVHMPAIAVAKGASIVFKHLAPKEEWRGPDWGVCLSPDKWKKCFELLRYAGSTSGNSKNLSQAEVKDRALQRRSLFLSSDLPAGHYLKEQDLVALRPGGGVDPKNISAIIGKRLKRSLPVQYMISIEDIY